jgi:hypothetical protein
MPAHSNCSGIWSMQPLGPSTYDLTPVRCPGKFRARDDDGLRPCPAMIDRREIDKDHAVHEAKCRRCESLYVYRFNLDGLLVVLSMLHPPPRRERE